MSIAGYGIAISGMSASERGLNVVGHNIANIDTPGYTKQQLIVQDSQYINFVGFGSQGLGCDIDELRQLRDSFLDINYRKENSNFGYWDIKNVNCEEIQAILDEPFGNGLQEIMNDFWAGWEEVAKNPDNLTVRALLVQKANVMINSFNHIGDQLSELQLDINREISNRVDQINSYAEQIAELNFKIKDSEISGDHANDYRDQRNLLLDKLSKIVDIDFKETYDNMMNVTISGIPLVFGVETQKVMLKENVTGSTYVSPAWESTGQFLNIKSGELKGYMEIRGEYAKGTYGSEEDGSPEIPGPLVVDIDEKQTIPSMKEKLNALLYTLTTSINAVHSTGYGIDNPPTTGTDFFTVIDSSKPFEMGNIQINPALLDLSLIAASTTGASGDNTNAQAIIALKQAKLLGTATDPINFDEFYRDTISRFGIKAQEAAKMVENQNNLTASITNKKESISGVNLDEEMANMLKYQHSYQANARVLNTIDSMLDRIFEMVGR